jgi:hypothetical protein
MTKLGLGQVGVDDDPGTLKVMASDLHDWWATRHSTMRSSGGRARLSATEVWRLKSLPFHA